MHSFKKMAAAVAIAGMMMPAAAFAQTTSTSSLQALLQQIQTLQAQIKAAQSQQQVVIGQLLTTLKQGDKGENVKQLQQLLASDPTLYPEGTISGFFGPRTAAAIKRFQKRHGIEQAGNFGPKTLKKFNEIFGHRDNASSTKSHEDGDDDHGKNDDKNKPCEGNNGLHLGWFIGNGNKDKEHDCKGNGQGTTTPDVSKPVISAVSATAITTTGATIVWTTNENSTSQVEFGTSTSYGSTSALNGSLVTAHSVVLTGLTANTTYNFRVWSKDAANNTATSSNMTFTTVALDTTAPVLSSVVSSAVATTTATITWNTNEAASGKVYFGTVNPLVLGSAATQSSATLATTHSFGLSGLSASTTYYYVVESTDASNNTGTSTQGTFTTTN